MELKHQLTPKLKQLRLSGILQTLDSRHRQAVDGKWSYVEFLERLLEDEVERRQQKQLSLRLRRSGVNTAKTIETFDFDFNPAINRQQILALAACDFIREKRNALLCGPPELGKPTFLKRFPRKRAARVFRSCTSMPTKCFSISMAAAPTAAWSGASKPIYAQTCWCSTTSVSNPSAPGAQRLYDVINERYEKGSILLTSNRAPSEWLGLFGDPLLGSAGFDRLCHRAEIVVIRGDSYRTQSRQLFEQEVFLKEENQTTTT